MAESPSHKLGQIAGYAMEEAFYDMLLPVANEFSLYVDRQGPRKARRGKKVTWIDDHNNKHDLDFVLERGGTATIQGNSPAAFIESAWRRYTKHSVNKAGEIANALVPLRRTYAHDRPFLGALVAGEWTHGGITHMESQGISVLHLPMSVLTTAFRSQGVDFYYDEATASDYMAVQVAAWDALGTDGQKKVVVALREQAAPQFEGFIARVREHLSRKVQSVRLLPLHGVARTANSVAEALAMLTAMQAADIAPDEMELVRIEVQIRYSNTDRIDAEFTALSDAIVWLEQHNLTAH